MIPAPFFLLSSFKAFSMFSNPLTVTDAQYPLLRKVLHVRPTAPRVKRVTRLDIQVPACTKSMDARMVWLRGSGEASRPTMSDCLSVIG